MTEDTAEPGGEQPDRLADFWTGDFPLGAPEPADRAQRGPLPIDQLAAPGIVVRGRPLPALLAPVYRALTS
ncbi:hypothetical protein [Kitasatospora sp. LaBMicrA B282]|uniref:hypothetical protein n=1 Tax=Kitasatospora sp. LaBMicrA B282 TaxID=3420949 RepID=UPI003D0C36E6